MSMPIHEPIKYVVRFRISANEDSAPVFKDEEVVAINVAEACAQAGMSLGCSFIDTQGMFKAVNIEWVRPAHTVKL